MRKGWESWGCSVWRGEGTQETPGRLPVLNGVYKKNGQRLFSRAYCDSTKVNDLLNFKNIYIRTKNKCEEPVSFCYASKKFVRGTWRRVAHVLYPRGSQEKMEQRLVSGVILLGHQFLSYMGRAGSRGAVFHLQSEGKRSLTMDSTRTLDWPSGVLSAGTLGEEVGHRK